MAPRTDSRRRILEAATREFAARGFAGAGVDRIARRARVNKALIYYYFASKAGLYREIVRGLFEVTGQEIRRIAASDDAPEAKIAAFAAALVETARRSPHLPPIMLREIAEQGAHLDGALLRLLSSLPLSLGAIAGESHRAGRFHAAHPLLAYFSMIGAVVFYQASGPIRARMKRLRVADLPDVDHDTLVRHVQRVALGLLHGDRRAPGSTAR